MEIDFKTQRIARNEALCENIFALIVCICNKIPILLCGKPGILTKLQKNNYIFLLLNIY